MGPFREFGVFDIPGTNYVLRCSRARRGVEEPILFRVEKQGTRVAIYTLQDNRLPVDLVDPIYDILYEVAEHFCVLLPILDRAIHLMVLVG